MNRAHWVCWFGAAALAALAVPLPAQERMLAMGDSITAGGVFDETCTSGLPEDCGYPRRLEQQLASRGRLVDVVNLGIGGEDTAEALSRVDEVLARGGTVLLLMEGTNDINRAIPPTTTRFNLNQIALRAEARGFQVVHATVIPRPPWANKDPDNLVTAEQAGQIRSMAYSRSRRLADPFERFSTESSPFTRLYSRLPDDFVGHPNAAGFELLARLFAEALSNEDLTPPVRGEIQPSDRATGVPADSQIRVELIDFGTGIDPDQTRLTVNDAPVPVTMGIEPRRIVLLHQPAAPLRAIVHVGVESRDRATPPNAVDRELASFVVEGTVFLTGDLDRSGRVDGADLVAFARRFGARRNESRYLAAADFNDDGSIDGVDLAALAANFGRSSF
jgi:lysophospholipase L1-like esterase